MKRWERKCVFFLLTLLVIPMITYAEEIAQEITEKQDIQPIANEYVVGIDDVLDINILQPEKMLNTVVVAPDGFISFPYIGSVYVKGLTLSKVQEMIQTQLAGGYMKYPVVAVSLKECRSKKFFVYGEVARPGAYPIDENISALQAISLAGGFTKFGSSRVKILRPRVGKPGYETIKVNINAVMNGSDNADINLQSGDIVVVSEGIL